MSITTIEDALANMCQQLTNQEILARAREAVSKGDVLEVTVLISPGKQGASVTMHSLVASQRQSHGRLIKLK